MGIRIKKAGVLDTIQDLTDRIRAYERQMERIANKRYPGTALFEPVTGPTPLTGSIA